jgi:hypothetical protein
VIVVIAVVIVVGVVVVLVVVVVVVVVPWPSTQACNRLHAGFFFSHASICGKKNAACNII